MSKQNMAINKLVPTLNDVADRAGVHKVTASVVLNGVNARTKVSEETRRRIFQAAEDLLYQPSVLSASFQKRRSNVIGFYSDYVHITLENPFQNKIVSSLQDSCYERGYDLLLHSYRAEEKFDTAQVRKAFLGSKTDGLVLHAPSDSPLVRYLSGSHLPIVAVGDTCPHFPSAVVDDCQGSTLVAQFLYQRGIRRVLYLDKDDESASSVRRRAAFLETAASLGLNVQIVPVSPGRDVPDEEQSYLHDAQKLPCAVVGWNDAALESVLQLCRQRGLQIPRDVSLVGFDGLSPLPNYPGRLTTIAAPWAETARVALQLLEELAAGREVARETLLRVSLQIGDSCL